MISVIAGRLRRLLALDATRRAGHRLPARLRRRLRCVVPFPDSTLRRRLRSFGGVRELRFGGGSGFGIILRVTRPWPVVQRFVVSQ